MKAKSQRKISKKIVGFIVYSIINHHQLLSDTKYAVEANSKPKKLGRTLETHHFL